MANSCSPKRSPLIRARCIITAAQHRAGGIGDAAQLACGLVIAIAHTQAHHPLPAHLILRHPAQTVVAEAPLKLLFLYPRQTPSRILIPEQLHRPHRPRPLDTHRTVQRVPESLHPLAQGIAPAQKIPTVLHSPTLLAESGPNSGPFRVRGCRPTRALPIRRSPPQAPRPGLPLRPGKWPPAFSRQHQKCPVVCGRHAATGLPPSLHLSTSP